MNHLFQVSMVMLVLTGLTACSCDPKPCVGNTCAAPTLVSVVVSDSTARGCELLLTEQSGTSVLEGRFDKGVVGTSVRESPRVALAFVAPGDATIPADGVRLALTAGTAAGVTITKSSCVDIKGARLPNATVSLR
jgi:hypothetical protein